MHRDAIASDALLLLFTGVHSMVNAICKATRLEALIDGGGHERGMRSGTLPVHQIVGIGAAAAFALADIENGAIERERGLRDRDPGCGERPGTRRVAAWHGSGARPGSGTDRARCAARPDRTDAGRANAGPTGAKPGAHWSRGGTGTWHVDVGQVVKLYLVPFFLGNPA